jgi:hypothetical protein
VLQWLSKKGVKAQPKLLPAVEGDYAVRCLLRNLTANEAAYTYPVDYRGVGRHCSFVLKPADNGKLVMWDPSPTFDVGEECPVWTRHNETSLNFSSFAEARLVQWTPFAQQSMRNRKRARKRKRAHLEDRLLPS